MKTIFTLSLAFCLSFFGYAQNERVAKVANNELVTFLNYIPKTLLKQHGFNSSAEFAKAKIGTQYQIMALEADGSLKPTGFYNVVVTIDGDYKALLTVGKNEDDGKLGIQGVGSALMAREIKPIESKQRLTANTTPLLVNDYVNKASYLSYKNANKKATAATLIPLQSAKTFLESQTNGVNPTYTLSELARINAKANSN